MSPRPTTEDLTYAALELHRRGWCPVPYTNTRDGKQPIPGVTGYDGKDLTSDELARHMASDSIIGLGTRMPEGVIGLDVDCHGDKDGAKTLELLAGTLGVDLPPTATTAGRNAEIGAGIRYYRVPLGIVFSVSILDAHGGGVDLIQRHHRTGKLWPSIHHATGEPYGRCDIEPGKIVTHDDDGEPWLLPHVDELPDLPSEYVDALATSVAEAREATSWDNPRYDDPSVAPAALDRIDRYWTNRAGGASRYDAMVRAVMALVRLDSQGVAGVGTALRWLRSSYTQAVGDTRTTAEAEAEFDRAHAGAIMKAERTKPLGMTNEDVQDILTVPTPAAAAGAAGGPTRFIDRDGLQAVTLARHVLDQGPIRPGADGRLWAWVDGYWQPSGGTETLQRVREALGERFRPSHANTIDQWLRGEQQIDPNRPDFATINCLSGLLDWRTGELRPHTQRHLSTTRLPTKWDPDATCPAIDAFLAQVLEEDALDFFYEVVGYMCAAGNPLHVALLFLGSGRNGKGTALRMIEKLIGSDNCASITPHQLADNRFAAATLYGKQANIAGDLEARLIERTDLFKMATGGDTISAEHKYGQAFTFKCWATFAFSANEPPAVRDHSEGYYARWLVVPFSKTIAAEERLPEHVLDTRLHAPKELEGLFVKAVEGLRRLMERGRFDAPESVLRATELFRAETDPITQFLSEETHRDIDGMAPRNTLYDVYRTWCINNGRNSVAASKLYSRVESLDGVRQVKVKGVRGFRGLAIGHPVDADDDWELSDKTAPPAPSCPPALSPALSHHEGGAGVDLGGRRGQVLLPSPVYTGKRVQKLPPPAPPAPQPAEAGANGVSHHGWTSRR